MKKTLSFLLALTILLCALPLSVAAKESINEVHIAVGEPANSAKAYSDIPTVPDEYRSQYSISKWYWCYLNTGEKLKEDDVFLENSFYSLVLVLDSTDDYDFANDTVRHLFTFVADGISLDKYSVSISEYEDKEPGKIALVKIDFDATKEAPEIKINSIPSVSEGAKNTYSLSYGTYTSALTDYDNATTIKNGVMWEDITDPDDIIPMNINDTFLIGHKYRISVYVSTPQNFKYNFSLDKVYMGSVKLTNVQPLDLDDDGYVTKLKLAYDFSAVPHTRHNWVVTNVVPATMEANGSKSTECSICGASVADEIIPRITINKYPNEKFIYYKNNYYTIRYSFVSSSSNPYVYRTLKCGEDYDIILSGTGEVVYNFGSVGLKGLSIGTHNLQIVFKGDYAGVVNRKITVSLGEPKWNYSSGTSTIKLYWNSVDAAQYYRVYQKNLKTGKITCVAKKVTGKSFVVKGKTAGTKYSYTVRAYRTSKDGKTYSSTYTFKNVYTRCKAPVVKAKVSGNKVKLYWTSVKGAKSYTVYKYNPGKEVYEKFRDPVKTKSMTFVAVKGKYLFKVAANGADYRTGKFSKPVKVAVK